MANNRMYIANKRTGAKLMLAKYYPSTGWYCHYDDLINLLDKLFDDNEPPPTTFGSTEWHINYEIEK